MTDAITASGAGWRWEALDVDSGPGDDRPGDGPVLLVGTRKGAWLLSADADRPIVVGRRPQFLGHIVKHVVLDPRDRRTLLAGAAHRPPRSDRVAVRRPRPDLERGDAPAGVRVR